MSAELPRIWEQINQIANEAWYKDPDRKLSRIETVDGALIILDQVTSVMKNNAEIRQAIANSFFTEEPALVRAIIHNVEYAITYKANIQGEILSVSNGEEEFGIYSHNPLKGEQHARITYKEKNEEDSHVNDVYALKKASGMSSELKELSEL